MKRARRLVYNKARKVYEAPLLEEHVVREFIVRLGYAQIRVVRVRERIPTKGTAKSTSGIPDLFGWVTKEIRLGQEYAHPETAEGGVQTRLMKIAVPLFIEVKRPGGRHRFAQKQFIADAKAAGCIAFFADSWAVVVQEMQAAGVTLPA